MLNHYYNSFYYSLANAMKLRKWTTLTTFKQNWNHIRSLKIPNWIEKNGEIKGLKTLFINLTVIAFLLP